MPTITHKIYNGPPYGITCQFCYTEDGYDDINDLVPLSSAEDDPTALIEARVAVIRAMPVEQPEQPSILLSMEQLKEQLKWDAISWIKENPGGSAEQFSSTLLWNESALVQTCIYQYAAGAQEKGFVELPDTNLDTCWAVLVGLVNTMPEDQLKALLS